MKNHPTEKNQTNHAASGGTENRTIARSKIQQKEIARSVSLDWDTRNSTDSRYWKPTVVSKQGYDKTNYWKLQETQKFFN